MFCGNGAPDRMKLRTLMSLKFRCDLLSIKTLGNVGSNLDLFKHVRPWNFEGPCRRLVAGTCNCHYLLFNARSLPLVTPAVGTK
jgi:hypothetical protein